MCLSSCSEGEPVATDALVVEGWIDSNGYPVVLLTKALAPTSSDREVADAIVRWGRVTISDGIDTVVMTGGPDLDRFPPYSYKSFAMRGEVGRTYRIVAEVDGMSVSGESTILPPPTIEDVKFVHVAADEYGGELSLVAPEDADTCRYVVYTRVRNLESDHFPSFMGVVSSFGKGESLTVPFFRGKHIGADENSGYNFCLGDTVDILVARVSEVVFDFWDDYQNEVYFGNNLFLSSGNSALKGNIMGGMGVFAARGVARRICVVGKESS